MRYYIYRFMSTANVNGEQLKAVVQFSYQFTDKKNPVFSTPSPPSNGFCGQKSRFIGLALGFLSYVPVVGLPAGIVGMSLATGCAIKSLTKVAAETVVTETGIAPATNWDCTFCNTVVADTLAAYNNITNVFGRPWDPSATVEVDPNEMLPFYQDHINACQRNCWKPTEWKESVNSFDALLDQKTCTFDDEVLGNLTDDQVGPAVEVAGQCSARLSAEAAEEEEEAAGNEDVGSALLIGGVLGGVAALVSGVVAAVVVVKRRQEHEDVAEVGKSDMPASESSPPSV
jgi:hypothetical protein